MSQLIVRGASCVALALAVCLPALRADDKPADRDGPAVSTKATEKGSASTIRVLLPTPEAKVWFDGVLTKATGKDRIFRSPALDAGKRYTYRVVAAWAEKGREVNHETKITFRAGEDVRVDFRR
jgi:uncharacterized protein (TIGR03000 family)